MKRLMAASVLVASVFFGSCVTEPAPEEPTVYGQVSKPKKRKAAKPAKKPVIKSEVVELG
jgi:hypothetical protein